MVKSPSESFLNISHWTYRSSRLAFTSIGIVIPLVMKAASIAPSAMIMSATENVIAHLIASVGCMVSLSVNLAETSVALLYYRDTSMSS